MTQTRTYDTFVLFEPYNKPLMPCTKNFNSNPTVISSLRILHPSWCKYCAHFIRWPCFLSPYCKFFLHSSALHIKQLSLVISRWRSFKFHSSSHHMVCVLTTPTLFQCTTFAGSKRGRLLRRAQLYQRKNTKNVNLIYCPRHELSLNILIFTHYLVICRAQISERVSMMFPHHSLCLGELLQSGLLGFLSLLLIEFLHSELLGNIFWQRCTGKESVIFRKFHGHFYYFNVECIPKRHF